MRKEVKEMKVKLNPDQQAASIIRKGCKFCHYMPYYKSLHG